MLCLLEVYSFPLDVVYGLTSSHLARSELISMLGKTPTPRNSHSANEPREIFEECAVYLLPHFGFDPNAKQLVQRGNKWFDDHGCVQELFSHVSGIPERLQMDFTDIRCPEEISSILPGEKSY